MGTYRTVVAPFPCEHCHATFASDVQFKTGDDRDMQRYEQGQSVAGDPLLRPGSVFEAFADRYCPTCSGLLSRDSALLVRAALFELVEANMLVLKRYGVVLTWSELLALKNGPWNSQPPHLQEWLSGRSLSLHFTNEVDDQTFQATGSAAVSRVERRSTQLLAERGWHTDSGVIRDDLQVLVSASAQLWATLPASPNVA